MYWITSKNKYLKDHRYIRELLTAKLKISENCYIRNY